MGFYESGTNNSVRKGKVNSETLNWSISNLFCVLSLVLPRQHCVHCDLAKAPLCGSDGERCSEVLHRTCYGNQAAANGWSILCLDPKQEVILLVKRKRINGLSQGHTSSSTHRVEGQVELQRQGNGGSHVQQGDNILQISLEDRPDMLCHRNEGPHRNAFQYE